MQWMRPGLATALLASLAIGAMAQEADPLAMTWPEATELLQREKLSAEVCARAVKRGLPAGDLAALTAAEQEYEAGRIEFNAVISGLQVALHDTGTEALALGIIEDKLTAGSRARAAFATMPTGFWPTRRMGRGA
jgi:hypothetical protein